MARPAPLYDDVEESDDYGWPAPARVRSLPPPSEPRRRRRRRSRLDAMPVVLGALGVLLAAAAGLWYLQLGRGAPPAELTVPSVVGMQETPAVEKLTTLGFNVRAVERPGETAAGVVFSQRPGPATLLSRGATVTIRVANGQKPLSATGKQAPQK